MLIRPFQERDADAVVALWEACGLTRPWNDPRIDIERKLSVQRELFLVGEVEGHVMASVMAVVAGHRGWVNYLAVSPTARGAGHGRSLMDEVELLLIERGCPKINLQVRADNADAIGFYAAIGYDVDAVTSLGRRLIED